MASISVRLPEDLADELERYAEAKNIDESAALRKLVADGLDDWRAERALERLEAGEVTLSRAAEITGMTVWEFTKFVKDEGVSWVADDHLNADLRNL